VAGKLGVRKILDHMAASGCMLALLSMYESVACCQV